MSIAGSRNQVEHIGIVQGSTVRSRNVGSDFFAIS